MAGGAKPLLDTPAQLDAAAAVAEPEMRTVDESSGLALVVERLAANPGVDVEKLERIIALQERILKHNAKAAFDGAFSQMQAELPEVAERGRIEVKGTVRSTYAKLEDVVVVLRPILKKFGFAVRHRTEWPADRPGIIRIVGILSHEQGHSEESSFEAGADKSDYRTDIQSMGSTVSYGRRYTLFDLLNITTRHQDDDGQSAGRPTPPEGYDAWWSVLEGVAAQGFKALDKAWSDTKIVEFKNFTVRSNAAAWKALRESAAKVKA